MATPDQSRDSSSEKSGILKESDKALLDLAWAEWDLIQKKIDSVSTFPFTVKTWSVAVSGFILGLGKGFDIPSQLLFVTILVPIVFKAVESKHNRIRDILSKRAETLELLIERLVPLANEAPLTVPRSLRRDIGRLPGIALSIIRAGNDLRRDEIVWEVPEGKHPPDWGYRNLKLVWHKYVVTHADEWFYFLQVVLMIAVAFGLYLADQKEEQAKAGKPVTSSLNLPR